MLTSFYPINPNPSISSTDTTIERLPPALVPSTLLNTLPLPSTRPFKAKKLPTTLTSIYDPRCKNMSDDELTQHCEEVFKTISITKDESIYLAEATRLQSLSVLWHTHRKGRITASSFGKVYHTNISTPSVSLRRSILHRPTFRSEATEWGTEKEEIARQAYLEIASRKHQSLTLSTTGLCVNPLYPHLGASPDALISDDAVGRVLLKSSAHLVSEIKTQTLYVIRKMIFFLQHTVTGLNLSQKHNYYFQIQGQLAICERSFCDFVCWTPEGIYTERVTRDLEFLLS